MDPTSDLKPAPTKVIVIVSGVVIVILLVVTLIVSGRRSSSSGATPTPSVTENGGSGSSDSPLSSPKISANFPTSYNNSPISKEFYTQGIAQYGNSSTSKSDTYIATMVKNYYAYSDALKENKIAISPAPKDFKSLEAQVPVLQSQVEANLLSSADFAYIKARYRYHPHASFVEYKFGDLKTKAFAKINYYRDLLLSAKYTPENLVAISNNDEELMLLNNYEKNEFRTNYTAAGGLFFTDKKFHDFLFSQKANTLSEIYQLKSIDSTDYAYLLVFPTNVTNRKYRTIAELLADKDKNFK